MFDIRSAAKRLIDGSVIRSEDGVKLYTPDGAGTYPALWTRDFAYMITQCFELFDPADIEEDIRYLIRGARAEDGWIPDRVYRDGTAVYHAGGDNFPAGDNLDNGPFLILAAGRYLKEIGKERAEPVYREWRGTLYRGIGCLPTDENGLIRNTATPLHSPYGFTDTVCKGGLLSMETLLLWEALRTLDMLDRELTGEPSPRAAEIAKIEDVFEDTFSDGSGMLITCTGQCRHIDIWASAYAVYNGFPLSERAKTRISEYLCAHYGEITEYGQIRHLPAGEFWEETFLPVPRERYQNGAFWATPVTWFCRAVSLTDPALAKKTVASLLSYFETYGIFECVNGDYRQLDTYVASATSAYAAYKEIS